MAQVQQEVRKSIVRISFDWKKRPKNQRFMVIAGIILSVNADGSAVIAANSTFFGIKQRFVVNFPNATGYEEGQALDVLLRDPNESGTCERFESVEGFYVFTAKPIESGYIKAVRFETQPVQVGDTVHSFVFPREGYITPTAYTRGSVMDSRKHGLFGCYDILLENGKVPLFPRELKYLQGQKLKWKKYLQGQKLKCKNKTSRSRADCWWEIA